MKSGCFFLSFFSFPPGACRASSRCPMATRGRWDRQLRRRQPPTLPPRSWTVSPEFLCLRRGRAVMLLCVAQSARLMRICDGKPGPRPRRGAQAKAVHAGTLSKKAEDRGGQNKTAREGGRKSGRGREREREGGRGGAPHTHHAHAHASPTCTRTHIRSRTDTPTPTPTRTRTRTRTGVRVSGVIINSDREILCLLLLCVRVCMCVSVLFTRARVRPTTRECETLCAFGGVTKFVYPSLCMGHMHGCSCMCEYVRGARRFVCRAMARLYIAGSCVYICAAHMQNPQLHTNP